MDECFWALRDTVLWMDFWDRKAQRLHGRFGILRSKDFGIRHYQVFLRFGQGG